MVQPLPNGISIYRITEHFDSPEVLKYLCDKGINFDDVNSGTKRTYFSRDINYRAELTEEDVLVLKILFPKLDIFKEIR